MRSSGDPTCTARCGSSSWVNAVGFAALALLAAWLLRQVNPRRPWDAAIFALSPALALTGLINWDLLAVGVRRRRAVGVVAGTGRC